MKFLIFDKLYYFNENKLTYSFNSFRYSLTIKVNF